MLAFLRGFPQAWHSRPVVTRAPRGRSERERLLAHIAELEQRIVLLEAKVRQVTPKPPQRPAGRRAARAQRRPRCPGCLLELPKGRRDACVWCGFWLEAGRSRSAR